MADTGNDTRDDLTKRLDLLIFLQLDERFPSVTDKITKLAEAGLGSTDIAAIVGKKNNYVGAILSRYKKGGKNRRKDSE